MGPSGGGATGSMVVEEEVANGEGEGGRGGGGEGGIKRSVAIDDLAGKDGGRDGQRERGGGGGCYRQC
jgi:hypothetical protein